MAVAQPAAGLVRDVTGDPGTPMLLGALLLAATLGALALFWRIEARPPRV